MTKAYFSLAASDFNQDWSNTGQITANDDWSGVPSIIGYLGDDTSTTVADRNAATITRDFTTQNVIANQTGTTIINGGIAEFQLANPTIALQGSGTADNPNLVLYLDATGRKDVTLAFDVRDIDANDNAVQQIAVQYRTSPTGAWINLPAGYIADATAGPGLAQPVTHLVVTLPGDANGAATLEVRIMTSNAGGNDEWVGIDNIHVGSSATTVIVDHPGSFAITDSSVVEGNAGTTPISFTVSREAGSNVAATVHYQVNLPGGAAGASAGDFSSPVLSGDLSFGANELSKTITLQVVGDTANEANESFSITLSAPTNGAAIADGTGAGTIVNDDAFVSAGAPFINEIHYDNAGTDSGESIEIAGPAGIDLSGWSLALYDGNGGKVYNTRALAGLVPNQDDGYGTLSFAYGTNGIQNGSPDGIALVDPSGRVVQFLSYEGAITAVDGPAAGTTSTDIGVAEDSGTAAGFSLRLAGSGASYDDFTWQTAQPNSFGAVNLGQNFIAGNATGLVSVTDAQVVEGDNGTSQLVFTVHRAGGLDQIAGADWFLNLTGSADQADLGAGQPLSGHVDFGIGVSKVTISIGVAGDTVGEGNESLNLLLANPTGNIAITDGAGAGTILNDDPIALTIMEIQGAAHKSPYEGQPVATTGIVTAVALNGFYLQDPHGDGNAATSDAIFVFTGTAPTVAIGDGVGVSGIVNEFLPSNDASNLTTTEINAPIVTIQSHGNALPAAVLIGADGVLPPSQAIEDDGFAVFDPQSDGLDFYESLEGMLVTVEAPVAVGNTSSFGETWVVASGGAGASGMNGRDGITLSPGDYNPERIQIQSSSLFPGYTPDHSQGDRLSDVTGILSYSHNSYEVLVSQPVTTTLDVTLGQETTSLAGDRNHLTIASYNVENLDLGDGAGKYDILASNIIYNLAAPGIIGLQEVQDADGPGAGADLSGVKTAQALIDAIKAIGGPNYVYIEVAPSTPNSSGGEPNGNIRPGFLYNADRLTYVDGSAHIIDDPAFAGSRKPLVGDFLFNGQKIELINVHFTSRLGSDSLEGAQQPPADAGDGSRTAQGQAVAAYVNNALATDPSLKLGVVGDFNGFYFEGGVGAIEGTGVMTDLHRLLAPEERYSYFFDGNAQAIDHIIVSPGLLTGAAFDAVHLNAEFGNNPNRPTDHDPIVARFTIQHPNEAPTGVALDHAAVDENRPAGTLVGTASASDPDGDVLTWSLADDAGGRFAIDPATGAITTTQPFDHEAVSGYTVTVRATDPAGLAVDKAFSIAVGDVNEAPTGLAIDHAAVDENQPAGTAVGTMSAADPEGQALTWTLADDAGGRFAIDPVTGAVTIAGALDYEAAHGYQIVARATDAGGLSTDQAFAIAIGDVNEAPTSVALDHAAVDENRPAGTLVGTASGSDPEGRALTWSLADDAGGRFAIDPATGRISTTQVFDFETASGYAIIVRATDAGGLTADKGFDIAIGDVNEAPTARPDAVAVNEDATSANLWSTLLANDSDPDAGTQLSIASVDTTGMLGHVLFDAATQSLRYVADNDAFDALPVGATRTDSFRYTIDDGHGLVSSETVTVTVTGIADGVMLTGGNGNSVLTGTGGEDILIGGNGNDILSGLDGHDLLAGGNGNDSLYGGAGNDGLFGGNGNDNLIGGDGKDLLAGGNGNDVTTGGAGADLFLFARGGGNDTITDFNTAVDRLLLADGISVKSWSVGDVNHDGIADLTIAFSNGGGQAVLLGVGDMSAVHADTAGAALVASLSHGFA
ncbi:MAG: uncharacterized protein QOH81_936 [Sphingomonadales bacterium]|nr:uncharacterized protein [Sphingomonadales bacterium]